MTYERFKLKTHYYYLCTVGFIPSLINAMKEKFWTKVKNSLINQHYEYFSRVFENEPYSAYHNTGDEYTISLQVPVNVVFLCIYKVYGTMFVPVYSITTNLQLINPEKDKAVVTIYTDRPGKFIGTGGKKIDELIESLKVMFNCKNLTVELKESLNTHHPYDLDDF